jgi:hypothetical protein
LNALASDSQVFRALPLGVVGAPLLIFPCNLNQIVKPFVFLPLGHFDFAFVSYTHSGKSCIIFSGSICKIPRLRAAEGSTQKDAELAIVCISGLERLRCVPIASYHGF